MKAFIGIVCLYLIVGVPVYAMLCVAGREDEWMERMFREQDSPDGSPSESRQNSSYKPGKK